MTERAERAERADRADRADREARVMRLLEVESTLTDRYQATSPSEDSALEPFLDILARELAEKDTV